MVMVQTPKICCLSLFSKYGFLVVCSHFDCSALFVLLCLGIYYKHVSTVVQPILKYKVAKKRFFYKQNKNKLV